MEKVYTIVIFLLLSTMILPQNETEKKDTLWTPKGVIGLNVSQVSFTNWTQGGENSLSFTIFTHFNLDYIGDPWTWKNNLKLTYGRTKTGNQEIRTNDNEIFFESSVIRNVGWVVNPYADVTARTAITDGFKYDDTPVQIVGFFDPLYLTEGIGVSYDKIENFSTRAGLGFKQTIANKFAMQYSDDSNTPEIEKFKSETGIESVTEYKWAFLENMEFTTYLRLFGTFDDLSVWDVRWDNTVVAKINDYFNVNLNVLLIYDTDETLRTQLKQALQLGFSYTLF
jgi:Protein of unknown function (DUF3078)